MKRFLKGLTQVQTTLTLSCGQDMPRLLGKTRSPGSPGPGRRDSKVWQCESRWSFILQFDTGIYRISFILRGASAPKWLKQKALWFAQEEWFSYQFTLDAWVGMNQSSARYHSHPLEPLYRFRKIKLAERFWRSRGNSANGDCCQRGVFCFLKLYRSAMVERFSQL